MVLPLISNEHNIAYSGGFAVIKTAVKTIYDALIKEENIKGFALTNQPKLQYYMMAQIYSHLWYLRVTSPYNSETEIEHKEQMDYDTIRKCFSCLGIDIGAMFALHGVDDL